MKEFLKRKWLAVKALYESKVKPRIKSASPVVAFLLMALTVIAGIALFLAVVAAVIFVSILLPGMIVGFFAWFVWTYMQFGLTYFPSLPPVYQAIPYWHFAWGSAVLILIWRTLRKKGYGKDPAGVPGTSREIRAHNSNWRLRK